MKERKPAKLQFFNCHIAGFSHWEGCLVLSELKPGAQLELEREPNNPFDHHAVAVYYGETKLGYLPMAANEDTCTLLDMGHGEIFDARVQSVNPEAHPEKQVRLVVFIRAKRKQ